MAGFKTHVTTSSVLGVAYGAAGFWLYELPAPSCVLATGLCGVSGMLPDLDSEPGRPLRESVAFTAAVVPMLLVDRFKHMGMPHESMVLAGALVYLLIRFGMGAALGKITVHRGMFHSLPAMLIAAQIAFLLSSGDLTIRCYKAGAVMAGFLSHLVLDEIWSIKFRYGLPHLKSSFGTAMKFWGDCGWANVLTYAFVIAGTLAALNDPIWETSSPGAVEAHQMATSILNEIRR